MDRDKTVRKGSEQIVPGKQTRKAGPGAGTDCFGPGGSAESAAGADGGAQTGGAEARKDRTPTVAGKGGRTQRPASAYDGGVRQLPQTQPEGKGGHLPAGNCGGGGAVCPDPGYLRPRPLRPLCGRGVQKGGRDDPPELQGCAGQDGRRGVWRTG